MSLWLLLDTAGDGGSVALADQNAVLASESLPGRAAGEQLYPLLRRLLERQSQKEQQPRTVQDLAVIGVVLGPGSFTGLRIGISAAKGLCEAAGARMVGLSRLRLLAGNEPEVLSLLDAGRGEFFGGLYQHGSCVWERLLTPASASAESADRLVVTCEDKVVAAFEPGRVCLVHPALHFHAAVQSCALAEQWTDVATADALYLRRPDAEQARL